MSKDEFRQLSAIEKSILAKLLEAPLPESDVIRKQIERSQVKSIDANGSLEFLIDSSIPTLKSDGALVTGSQPDHDTVEGYGPYIHFILFSRSGFISHLDIYKDDGSDIRTKADPNKFVLTYGTSPKKGKRA